MQNAYKYSFVLAALLLFLSIRVAHVHAWTHMADEDHGLHCELCDVVVASQHYTPLDIDTSEWTFPVPQDLPLRNSNPVVVYQQPLQSIASPDYVYNKPPPFY